MTDTGIPTAESDVQALMLGTFGAEDDPCIADVVGREVTMRGDLQQMPLGDVFQSLGMSKMEGILRLRNAIETREIYFRDGTVRAYITERAESRRLGVQLMLGGLIAPEGLRAILFEQKKSGHSLRQLLVENRVLPEAEVDELFQHRAAEDLYGLFTWSQGSFDFYRGSASDPVIQSRLDALKAFDVSAVLMEVARRSDEWELLLDTIRSVDELVVPVEGAERRLKNEHLDVLRALDGHSTVRMLAPSMLYGLFELSRIVRDLLKKGHARFATNAEGIEASRGYLSRGNKRLAIAMLETLAARTEGRNYTDLHAIATLFQEAGEPRRAATMLLGAAGEAPDPGAALEMLQDARALSPRSCEVLQHLRDCLTRLNDPARSEEFRQLTDDYCNALIEDGRFVDSLAILDQLEADQPGDTRLAFRRAIVLNRLGRRDDAVSGLLALAGAFKAAKQREQLFVVYEQVLKIDPRRRDVTRALRRLRATQLMRRLRVAAVAVSMVAAGAAGVVTWRSQKRSALFASTSGQVAGLLASGDVAKANELVDSTAPEIAAEERVAALRELIQTHLAKQHQAAIDRAATERRARLGRAAAHFERGELEQAIEEYAAILRGAEPAQREDLRNVVRARFKSLVVILERQAEALAYAMPPAPGITIDSKARRRAIEDVQAHFQDADLERARACLRTLEHEICRTFLDQDTSTSLDNACAEIVRAFGLADARRTAYQSLEATAEVGRRLQPLVLQATEHEAQHRYKEAAEAYRTLTVEHPQEDDLKTQFRVRAARSGKIADGLAAVASATTAGDTAGAWRALRALQSEFPRVPVMKLVRLPIAIDTSPSRAGVWIGQERVGTTPLHTTLLLSDSTTVRIELDGFEPLTRAITGDESGSLRLTLVKLPTWSVTLNGPITQTPATDGRTSLFAVDRAGWATSLALETGRILWSVESSDLSGLLPRPVVFGNHVVLGSADGAVLCLHVQDGSVVWERAGVPVEVAPVARTDAWVAATLGRRVVVLAAETGKTQFEAPLPHTPAGLAVDERVICCALTNGEILGLDAFDGSVRWRKNIDQVIAAPPTTDAGLVFVIGEEGKVAAYDMATGEPRWEHNVGALVPAPAVLQGDNLWVAAGTEVTCLATRTGAPRRRVAVDEVITSLGVVGNRLIVGTIKGTVIAHDLANGQQIVRLRGPGRVTAAPLVVGDWLFLGFEGKELHAYRGLP